LNSYNVNGHPHRAFSLFLFNRNNELLLHKRSKLKIAFPSAWTNSCCSHPKVLEFNAEGFKPEPVENGVVRRTIFELGIDLTGQKLCHVDKILYRSPYDEEWGEHEVDYVFFCKVDADVAVKHNPDEIDEYKWVSKNELLPFMKDVEEKGGHMTPWFKKIYHSNKLIEWWETLINEGIEALSHLKPNSVRSFK
jgi:isopentenyl-diphosphate delta-isomerase